jgi:hypothetical protein
LACRARSAAPRPQRRCARHRTQGSSRSHRPVAG